MSLKNKMLVFGLRSTSDDWPSDQSKKSWLKCKKKNPKSSKNEISVLDYVQLLMISWVIWVTNINRYKTKNKKRPPNSSKNKMPIFGLCSTSDDQLSDLNDEQLKQKKKKKQKKKAPLTLWKIKCSFLDYVQLLMICQAIWVMNINRNAEKWRKAPYVIKK